MYRCYICDNTFEDPEIYHYSEDMNGEGARQDFYLPICPACGSEEIDIDDETEEQWTAY